MLHLYDRATMAHALTLDLDPPLHRLLAARITALGEELIDWTEFAIVEIGDTENDMIQRIGLSPLVDPMDGFRFGSPAFWPHWAWITRHDDYWELHFVFGSTFGVIVFVPDREGILPELLCLCRTYADG